MGGDHHFDGFTKLNFSSVFMMEAIFHGTLFVIDMFT